MNPYFSKAGHKITDINDIREIESIALEDLPLPASSYQLLKESAANFSDQIALRFLPFATLDEESITLTYQQLFARITQTANGLHSLGVTKDDVVSMMLPNLPQTHFTIWGAEAAGIFNPINPLLDVEHIAAIINEAKSKVLVTLAPTPGSDLWEKAQQVKALAPDLQYVVAINLFNTPEQMADYLSASVLDFDALINDKPAGHLVSGRVIASTDIASYFHTGGTTGTPKLAPHTHANEIINCYQMCSCLEMNAGSRALCGLPLFHVNGVFVTGLAPWMTGAEVILATAAGYRTPEVISNFWGLVEKYQISLFSCVPTILSTLLEIPSEDYDLSSLDTALCGAAPLATELFRKFEDKTGITLVEGYGQTEGTCCTSANPKFGDRRIGSVGLPVPYLQVRIVEVDENGLWVRDCDTNESGEIVIKGPNVFSGYKQPSQNEGQWPLEGWFNTGDLGRLDEDGYLWLTGRSKDLIIRGGHNIDPQMIEEAYYKRDDIAEAVAIGKPDKRVGELPVLFVQMKQGCEVSAEELINYGNETIHERAAVPKEVYFVDAMPVTAVGKIFKPTLRNDLVKQMVSETLQENLSEGFSVEVVTDKKFGQCVTVTCDEEERVTELLGDYAFKLNVSSVA
ncbi:MAG: acyl-CoA synthetase [Candidatus Pelagadaptatus aseana]|uniref:acyl-CoA synthetase n=1 Tax=Candidatus Pelagadaptatus aseana TaxID=3120508 RepID=UPI0039B1348E